MIQKGDLDMYQLSVCKYNQFLKFYSYKKSEIKNQFHQDINL
jgi:hypothetical protein